MSPASLSSLGAGASAKGEGLPTAGMSVTAGALEQPEQAGRGGTSGEKRGRGVITRRMDEIGERLLHRQHPARVLVCMTE